MPKIKIEIIEEVPEVICYGCRFSNENDLPEYCTLFDEYLKRYKSKKDVPIKWHPFEFERCQKCKDAEIKI